MSSLREQQGAFFASLAVDAGAPLLQAGTTLLQGTPRLAAAPRLEIYRAMGFARLHESLCDDYPQTRRLLGDEAFATLCRRYLAQHPSKTFSLNDVGAQLPAFVRQQPMARPDLGDLTALEWGRMRAWQAPRQRPLPMAQWLAGDAATVPHTAFDIDAGLILLDTAYPAVALWHALEHGEAVPPAQPGPQAVAIWREGGLVAHRALGPQEAPALAAARRGENFATLCAPYATLPNPAPQVFQTVQAWFTAGFIVGLHKPG